MSNQTCVGAGSGQPGPSLGLPGVAWRTGSDVLPSLWVVEEPREEGRESWARGPGCCLPAFLSRGLGWGVMRCQAMFFEIHQGVLFLERKLQKAWWWC